MSFLLELFCCQNKPKKVQLVAQKVLTPGTMPISTSVDLKSYETIDSFVNNSFNIFKSEHCHSKHNYKGIRKLGEGKFGNVYLMGQYDNDQSKIKKMVAIKIIKRNLGVSNEKLKKFIYGQKHVSKQLQGSPFIIYFISTFQNTLSGEKFFVYEYASGGTVCSLISNRFQQKCLMYYKNLQVNARFITACVIEGLSCLHSKNYIYRDLKPENLLIIGNDEHAKENEKGYVKLADFGLVWKLEGENAYVKEYAGTLAYSAPEAVARKCYNRAIDLWALGILVYELFTGQIPFTRQQLTPSKFEEHAKNLPNCHNFKQKNIPDSAISLILNLLEFEPTQRIGYKSLNEIKSHAFFKDFNWRSFENLEMRSPLKKIVTFCSNQTDMRLSQQSDDSDYNDNIYYQSNFTQLSVDSGEQ